LLQKHKRSEVYCFELCQSRGHTVATDRVAGYVPWLSWQLLQLVLCCV